MAFAGSIKMRMNNQLIYAYKPIEQIKQMEIEATTVPPSYKSTINSAVNNSQFLILNANRSEFIEISTRH